MSRNTPLIDFHKSHNGKIVDFAGWNLPLAYTSIMSEHLAVRNGAGLFDASHMGEFIVEGAQALRFLNYALSNDYSRMDSLTAKYGILCDEWGYCEDDLFIYKFSDTKFLIVANAANAEKDFRILVCRAALFDVALENVGDSFALLALQGKTSAQAMSKIALKEGRIAQAKDLPRFGFVQFDGGFVSRTGYTGSDGFEIFCRAEEAEEFANHILSVAPEVALCGLGSRDSLRLEAHYPLYGHEISKGISPLEAGLGWACKLDKDFVGRDALAESKKNPVKRTVKYFKASGKRMPRGGADVCSASCEKLGLVLSAAWSPVSDGPIGSALLYNSESAKEPLFSPVRDISVELEFSK